MREVRASIAEMSSRCRMLTSKFGWNGHKVVNVMYSDSDIPVANCGALLAMPTRHGFYPLSRAMTYHWPRVAMPKSAEFWRKLW